MRSSGANGRCTDGVPVARTPLATSSRCARHATETRALLVEARCSAHCDNTMKRIWIPQAIAGLMLAWALNPANPYGYYILLRIVCCAVCAYLAVAAASTGKTQWSWTLGILAVIYNPIMRIHLTRDIWSVVNVITVIILAVSIVQLGRKEEK